MDNGGTLQLQVSLNDMEGEDALHIALPHTDAEISLSELLYQVFPEDEEQQRRITSTLDVLTNPDLPEIYEAILVAMNAWRNGRCTLTFFGDSEQPLNPASPPFRKVLPPKDKGGLRGFPLSLHLHIHRQYKAVDYAVQQGFWDSKAELLEWLQTHTLLYFMDKHEFSLEASHDPEEIITSTMNTLQNSELIALSSETGTFEITQEGRRMIGRLLAETESYIDLYDHFKDTVFEEEADTVEFDTGNGADLRVSVFIDEGLDPVRTVFLLRLYDGTLDAFTSTWPERINDESFFNEILEPVVNRQNVDDDLLDRIVGAGYVYLEERHEAARESAEREELIHRAQAES